MRRQCFGDGKQYQKSFLHDCGSVVKHEKRSILHSICRRIFRGVPAIKGWRCGEAIIASNCAFTYLNALFQCPSGTGFSPFRKYAPSVGSNAAIMPKITAAFLPSSSVIQISRTNDGRINVQNTARPKRGS